MKGKSAKQARLLMTKQSIALVRDFACVSKEPVN